MDEPQSPNTTLDQVSDVDLFAYAKRDIEEIDAADFLVLFTVDPNEPTKRGGRHVEFGYALGRGKRVCIVGPKENIFHYLPNVLQFQTWEEFLVWLTRLSSRSKIPANA